MDDELKSLLAPAMFEDGCIDVDKGISYQVRHYLFPISGIAFDIDYIQGTQTAHSCSLYDLNSREWWVWTPFDTEECVLFKFTGGKVIEQKCNEKIIDLLKRLLAHRE